MVQSLIIGAVLLLCGCAFSTPTEYCKPGLTVVGFDLKDRTLGTGYILIYEECVL